MRAQEKYPAKHFAPYHRSFRPFSYQLLLCRYQRKQGIRAGSTRNKCSDKATGAGIRYRYTIAKGKQIGWMVGNGNGGLLHGSRRRTTHTIRNNIIYCHRAYLVSRNGSFCVGWLHQTGKYDERSLWQKTKVTSMTRNHRQAIA